MIKFVYPTAASKLGPIAVTYRAASSNVWGTCPDTCPLKPAGQHGADQIDENYLRHVRKAVPRNGHAWTYSHFPYHLLPKPIPGETVINPSCDSKFQAIKALEAGYTPVVAVPVNETHWPAAIHGVKFIRCPAETNKSITCSTCGNGRPLCARPERNYVIVFVGHGSTKKYVGTPQNGGCYGTAGPVAIQWKKASQKTDELFDDDVRRWATEVLPPGTLLRHHIVGDFGIERHRHTIQSLQKEPPNVD